MWFIRAKMGKVKIVSGKNDLRFWVVCGLKGECSVNRRKKLLLSGVIVALVAGLILATKLLTLMI